MNFLTEHCPTETIVNTPNYKHFLATENYFRTVIDGASEKGLSLVGRVVRDSDSQKLTRNPSTTCFARETTLLFACGDKAFLLAATYIEVFSFDTQMARAEVRALSEKYHPYWKFRILLGANPGMWYMFEDEYDWPRIARSFCGVEIKTMISRHSRDTDCVYSSGTPHQTKTEPYSYDGVYSILLGWWPIVATPDVFMMAIGNLLQSLASCTRQGRLSALHTVPSFAYSDTFEWDEGQNFLSQLDLPRLRALFEPGVHF